MQRDGIQIPDATKRMRERGALKGFYSADGAWQIRPRPMSASASKRIRASRRSSSRSLLWSESPSFANDGAGSMDPRRQASSASRCSRLRRIAISIFDAIIRRCSSACAAAGRRRTSKRYRHREPRRILLLSRREPLPLLRHGLPTGRSGANPHDGEGLPGRDVIASKEQHRSRRRRPPLRDDARRSVSSSASQAMRRAAARDVLGSRRGRRGPHPGRRAGTMNMLWAQGARGQVPEGTNLITLEFGRAVTFKNIAPAKLGGDER